MADSPEDLIEHLLEKITLSRAKGFTAVDFEEAVHSFYERKNDQIEITGDDQITVDETLIEAAFDRISDHEDVELQNDDQIPAEEQGSQSAALHSRLAGKRIFTSEERLWQTIAGHEIDLVRVPGMEFELLVVIAQHGPQGCLQSVVTQTTGQDKHSVPARTDKLAKKGYITKASVAAKHIRTSLLRLAKWAPSGPAPVMDGGMLSYDALFDTTIALLKDNGNIISIDDLYKGLDPKGKTNRKILLRCCQRLSQVGCTRLLRCRVQDEDGNPVMLAHGRGEKTVNAIQLTREPTTDDRAIWVNFRSRLGADYVRRETAASDLESGDEDADSEESAEDENQDAEGGTNDDAMEPRSGRDVSNMRLPDSKSALTPSRKSNRTRRKSSLAQGADYARLLANDADSDEDAEFEVTESASLEISRGPLPKTSTRTSPSRKKQNRPKKTPNEDGSVRRPRGPPQNVKDSSDKVGGESAGFSTFETTPVEASAAVFRTISNGEPPISSKRQRKRSTKALEADTLRAAGEPLLTEPVDELDLNDDSDVRSVGGAEGSPVEVDSDVTDDAELDMSTVAQIPNAKDYSKKIRGPYKKRDSAEKDKASSKKREPIVKKREIPPEEYEEYEKYAQATAERQVRLEMKTGSKRDATMAELDDTVEMSNKAPRTEEQVAAEDVIEDAESTTVEIPANRVAEVKASIIACERPGIYINPPGARNTKLENYVQRGRPRNAIIAVIKSDGLKNFPWFMHEGGPRFAPKASRRRTARIGEGLAKVGEDTSLFFVEGSGSEGEGEGRRKRKRRKFGEGQGRFRIEKRDGMPAPQAVTPGTFGTMGLRLNSAAYEDVSHNDADTQDESQLGSSPLRRTGRVSRRPSTGFTLAPVESEWLPTSDVVDGTTLECSEEQAKSTPSDLSSAARIEMVALQRKMGRPRQEDAIRIRVLQRQIEINGAARDKEAQDSAGEFASTVGGSMPLAQPREDSERAFASQNVEIQEEAQGSDVQSQTSSPENRDAPDRSDSTTQNPVHGNVVAQADAGDDRAAEPAEDGNYPAPNMETTDVSQSESIALDRVFAPAPTARAFEKLNASTSAVKADLDSLLTIKPKNRTPENLQRIEDLKSQIDDAYINGPGTIEELTTLQSKRGKRSVLVMKRVAVLKSRFIPEAEKAMRRKRASLRTGLVDAEEVDSQDHDVAQPNGSATVGGASNTASINEQNAIGMPQIEASGSVPHAHGTSTSPAIDIYGVTVPQIVTTTDDMGAVSSATQQTAPVVDTDSPATTQQEADSGRTKHKRAKAHTKVNEPKASAKKNDKWREKRALDTEERFDKAYVGAHPDEHFYHRGKGWYSRGQVVTKEYVDTHPEETFKTVAKRYIRLPDANNPRESTPPPQVALSEPLNQGMHSADSFNGLYDMYSKEYVENHPRETFYHRGGGKWHPGLPPPGSMQKTSVRGPGAVFWKRETAKAAKAALLAKAKLSFPIEVSAARPTGSPSESAAATPVSSLLTIYKPYSPKIIQEEGSSTSNPVVTNLNGKPTTYMRKIQPAATIEKDDVEITKATGEHDDAEREPTPSHSMDDEFDVDGDITMNDDDDDDNYVPHNKENDIGDVYIPLNEREDDERGDHALEPRSKSLGQQTPSSGWRVFFPVDLTAAVVVRRTEKQKQPAKPTIKRRARLQTVTKPGDEDLIDLTELDGAQATSEALTSVRRPAKAPRTPARGSKISRDIRLKAQRAWPYGITSMAATPASILALTMHPMQKYLPASGTFGTFPIAAEIMPPPEHKQQGGRRALRPRASLAKLPQALEDDYIETPGLIVKLKIKNLASVLPPDTAFESGLFAINAASDAVPVSRITGKPRRPYHKRSKKVTFNLDGSDGDEFRDDIEVEDEDMDEESDEFDVSEDEEAAVARPERRKRSTGVNGELRIRDMASGPAFKDADRLVIAFALVAAVCGGLRVEGINWTLIAHALGFRYDGTFLRRRWDHFKRTRKVDVDKLREAIQEPFLAAYEDDDFPRVDFQNLNNTDWPALFDWVQTTVVPHVRLQPEAEGPQVPDLLQSREEIEEQFEMKEPANLYESRLDEYFVTGTEQNRRSLVTKYTYGYAMPGESRPKDQTYQDMALLRSWVRAVAVTKQYNYHPEAAAQKLRKFSPEMLQQVTAEMIDNRTFSQERKSRILPGRNYQISNECLQSFRRWPPRPDECRFLRFVAQAWKNINTHFQSHDQLSLVPSASDPEYLVLTNMSAQGMIRITTIYPEVKEDYDAPFPKLSPWGYCGPTYETKKVDMSRLKFPIVYSKTAAYKDDHALLNHVPIPLYPPQLESEVGVRLPFWVDIHGNLIDDVWDMVLRSILHLLVFRSGTTANMIEQAHGKKLWAWEIEMALEWMREVGIAERIGGGNLREDGVWNGGWTAGEWWYCAFSPEVARWKAPAVLE